MKKLSSLLTIAFIAAAQLVSAQSNDQAAKTILDGVSAKFKSYKAVQAGFALKVEDSKGKLQGTKKGTVQMKSGKYHLMITGQEIFSDGKNVWTFDKASNEVTITKLESNSSMTPQKLFTNFYDKDFLYKLNGEKKEGTKTVQEIELTPTDKSKPFFKVIVNVDKASKSITSTKVMEKSGNRYTYNVSNFNGSANIPDATFAFDKAKFPGVEVVDLR